MAKATPKTKAKSPTTKETRRPVRKSAGKRSLPPDFVPSTLPNLDDSDTDDSTLFEEREEGIRSRALGKRTRSPTPPPLPTVHSDSEFIDAETSAALAATKLPDKLQLTFNVPPGHEGPFEVVLDIESLVQARGINRNVLPTPPLTGGFDKQSFFTKSGNASKHNPFIRAPPGKKQKTLHGKPDRKGFLDLAGEVRNRIYRLTFVDDVPLVLRTPSSTPQLARSAALLSTCRQVFNEGREILYGANTFSFVRDHRERGTYYEQRWHEIGFKDIRRFLTSIGPLNIALFRNLEFDFSDGSDYTEGRRGSWRFGGTHSHRFLDDDHLMQCLKILAKHSRLQKLTLRFKGRKVLRHEDLRFVDNLIAIKADKVLIVRPECWWDSRTRYANHGQIDDDLRDWMIKKMERKEKLHEEED